MTSRLPITLLTVTLFVPLGAAPDNVRISTIVTDAQGKPVEDGPTPTIRSLTGRGVIFVGCDLATRNFARRFADATKQEMRDVYAELKANLVPSASLLTDLRAKLATAIEQEAYEHAAELRDAIEELEKSPSSGE